MKETDRKYKSFGMLGAYTLNRIFHSESKPRQVNVAYCSSNGCAPGNSRKGIVKDVPPNTDTCPDCGYYLVWNPDR